MGRGRSNPVRQTINVKWDGSRLKLSGRASARSAGVGTFRVLCISHWELSEHTGRVALLVTVRQRTQRVPNVT